ncbi:MAG: nucleotidyltransferase family protein [Blautia sp.]|nr:nucleotidyltransferase family protein [Blautia sp.]MDY5032006.1 nucleotidyltransferase family protein [Blautia sp.]
MKKIALILLAAGNSRRFGSNKLLYQIGGKCMYEYVLDRLTEIYKSNPTAFSVTVVTQYAEIAAKAEEVCATAIFNEYPERGISYSVRLGIRANKDADACLFAVADQPWLRKETIEGLIHQFLLSGKKIGGVVCNDQMGNPCIFHRDYYGELEALEGDVGGKKILMMHQEDTTWYPVEEEKELTDLDQKPENQSG